MGHARQPTGGVHVNRFLHLIGILSLSFAATACLAPDTGTAGQRISCTETADGLECVPDDDGTTPGDCQDVDEDGDGTPDDGDSDHDSDGVDDDTDSDD